MAIITPFEKPGIRGVLHRPENGASGLSGRLRTLPPVRKPAGGDRRR